MNKFSEKILSKIFNYFSFSFTLKIIEYSKSFQNKIFYNSINYKIARIYEYCKKDDNYISKLPKYLEKDLYFLSKEEKNKFIQLIICQKINNNEDIVLSYPKKNNPFFEIFINDSSISNFILEINSKIDSKQITKFENRLKGIKISDNFNDINIPYIINKLIDQNKYIKLFDSTYDPDIVYRISQNHFLDSLFLKIPNEQIDSFLYFFNKQNNHFFLKRLYLKFIDNSKEIELNLEKFKNIKELTLISDNGLNVVIKKDILLKISKIFLKGCILKIIGNDYIYYRSKINELTFYISSYDYCKYLFQLLKKTMINKTLTISCNLVKYNSSYCNDLINEIISNHFIKQFNFVDTNKGDFIQLINKRTLNMSNSSIEKLLVDSYIKKSDINDIFLAFKNIEDFTFHIRNIENDIITNSDNYFILKENPYSTKKINSINIICHQYMKIELSIFTFDQLISISLKNCKFNEKSLSFFKKEKYKYDYIQRIELISTIKNCSMFGENILSNFYINIKKMNNLIYLKIQDSFIDQKITEKFIMSCMELKKLNSLIIIKEENPELNINYEECINKYPMLKKISSLKEIILTK